VGIKVYIYRIEMVLKRNSLMKKVVSHIFYEGERVKGSRFIASLFPTSEREELEGLFRMVKEEYPKATHYCFAWRYAQGDSLCSDAGEPSGSAGRPILRHLEGAELVDVLCVVVRYYGGTKLGIGGLVRAYGGAVSEALKFAELVPYSSKTILTCRCSYRDYSVIQQLIQRNQIEEISVEYGEDVVVTVAVMMVEVENLRYQVQELCSGRVLWVEA
jgi:uncharacterized YigZ family protein